MKIILTIFLLSLILLISPVKSEITVTTNPPGAQVSFDGVSLLSGISPVVFTQPIEGKYKLIIRKSGYDTYSKSFKLNLTAPENYNITIVFQ